MELNNKLKRIVENNSAALSVLASYVCKTKQVVSFVKRNI